jgi:hypothetical protein
LLKKFNMLYQIEFKIINGSERGEYVRIFDAKSSIDAKKKLQDFVKGCKYDILKIERL